MGNRFEINDENLEKVVGGAFHFYNHRKTGELLCYADGVGTYRPTAADSESKLAIMCVENEGLSQAALANLAVEMGILTPYV